MPVSAGRNNVKPASHLCQHDHFFPSARPCVALPLTAIRYACSTLIWHAAFGCARLWQSNSDCWTLPANLSSGMLWTHLTVRTPTTLDRIWLAEGLILGAETRRRVGTPGHQAWTISCTCRIEAEVAEASETRFTQVDDRIIHGTKAQLLLSVR
jgi:hypothetical protein